MTAFLDRLERELVDAAHRDAPRSTESVNPLSTLMTFGALAVVVVAVFVMVVPHRSGPQVAAHPVLTHGSVAVVGGGPRPRVGLGAAAPAVSFVDCAFAVRGGERELPRLVQSTRSPGAAVVDRVLVLRRPQRASDRVDVADVDRERLGVVETYTRYARMLRGPRGARIELIPAWICGPHNDHHHPFLALLAVSVDRPRATLLWATGATLDAGAHTITFLSGAHRFSATILSGGRTRILINPRANITPGAAGDRQA